MNHFIHAIKFNEKFRCFESGEIYQFKPGINLLVGDQGCGKSSMFNSIMEWQKSGISMNYDKDNNPQYRFLDTEQMNPRNIHAFEAHRDFKSISEYDRAMVNHVITRKVNNVANKSHGQNMLPMLLAHEKAEKLTFFIDEPESGLSIRSQYLFAEYCKKLAKNNQLIIATHSIVLMLEVGEVLSLEHKKWMPAKEFISYHTEGKLNMPDKS